METRRPFLTASWKYLLMANYEVPPSVLTPLVPRGTELDTWQGKTLVSVVGFRFLDTRLRGLPIPFHRDFDEVNLRFYLRRFRDGQWVRGVAFVKELVPRAALAWVARWVYGEPYVALPMRHALQVEGADSGAAARVRYEWKHGGRWCSLEGETEGSPQQARPGSEEEFISEHYWGWTARADGTTTEYEVTHPKWRVWRVASFALDADVKGLYGAAFDEPLRAPPRSVFLAEGSEICVYPHAPLGA